MRIKAPQNLFAVSIMYFRSVLLFAILECAVGSFLEAGMTEGRKIEGSGQVDINMKVQKINKTMYALSGVITIKVALDDSYQV
jgi:hypothetical protein